MDLPTAGGPIRQILIGYEEVKCIRKINEDSYEVYRRNLSTVSLKGLAPSEALTHGNDYFYRHNEPHSIRY